MHKPCPLIILVAWLTGSLAEAASYQKTDENVVEPILDT